MKQIVCRDIIYEISLYTAHCTMYLTLHSLSLELCSATINLKTLWSVTHYKKGHSSVVHCCTVVKYRVVKSYIGHCIALKFSTLFCTVQYKEIQAINV